VSRRRNYRLFFALVPDAAVLRALAGAQQALPKGGRPVSPANFHVTLAFLGSQDPGILGELQSIAGGLEFPPCTLTLDRFGHFPRAGVVWLGAEDIPDTLQDFRQALVEGLLDAGVEFDRKPWKFHVTLYRRLRKRPEIMDPVAIEWRLSGFDLMRSVSVEKGVEYHSLGHWPGRSGGPRSRSV
jgi:2'-5' RNA ligase